jgi:hypothetical protein
MWLPVWFLGGMLRVNRSLGLTLTVALALGLLVIGAQYLQSQDPVVAWQELLQPFVTSLVDAQLVDPKLSQQLLETMAGWMPGAIAAGFVVQSMAALILARWWQALLYNPGGFKQEFQQLRLPRVLAPVTLLVLVLNWFVPEVGLPTYLTVLLLAGWLIQGVSLVHALQTQLGTSVLWLVAMYAILPFFMPYVIGALALAGLTDSWFDYRARLGTVDKSDKTG